MCLFVQNRGGLNIFFCVSVSFLLRIEMFMCVFSTKMRKKGSLEDLCAIYYLLSTGAS